ncbi:leucine repeat adapter protein 25-like [Petromyzon marinus]|uniref:Leucine repeat adapter protein 25-like n=1 Tax=Petromyzon marinus TaxID=7757 RepID=A0AAJ7U8G4_PETMA|nr:leucine repeat adapter protein 25-like [Petromyzon marinus]XP_032830193.1 leucine repeat adapter protein 25-like [Petromyzon marinus]XP_032830194.1 leucine repeat adapter protein 25-like [Petromyzon marinus]
MDVPAFAPFPARAAGLPPLPRSLSALLHSSRESWRDAGRLYAARSRLHAELQATGSGHADLAGSYSSSSSSATASSACYPARVARPHGLGAALALLRREMVGLRQMDLWLLCQLWTLQEALLDVRPCSGLGPRSPPLAAVDNAGGGGLRAKGDVFNPWTGPSAGETEGRQTGTSSEPQQGRSLFISI